jgi:hypothetical protein
MCSPRHMLRDKSLLLQVRKLGPKMDVLDELTYLVFPTRRCNRRYQTLYQLDRTMNPFLMLPISVQVQLLLRGLYVLELGRIVWQDGFVEPYVQSWSRGSAGRSPPWAVVTRGLTWSQQLLVYFRK